MRRLLQDKEDTTQVFTILRALGGGEHKRNFKRFAATEVGQRVIRENRRLAETLNDRDYLASLPDGTLGRAYLDFCLTENISADGLDAAAEQARHDADDGLSEGEALFRDRLRDTHDLWHLVSSYGRDGLGELCLLAFTYSQVRSLGVRFIVFIGKMDGVRQFPNAKILKAVREGYRRGRNAPWLPSWDWEALLEQPLSEVQAKLAVEPPLAYRESFRLLEQAGAHEFASRETAVPA
ncbi:MAG: Coq4 family protein [Alphaproteobacteria bacterium]|nr:Coq4 family protein [Alphaproteobacteria bacterium]